MTNYNFTNITPNFSDNKKIHLELKKPYENISVFGTLVVKKNEKFDVDIDITHKAKNVSAKILVKAVLYDNAQLAFKGKVKVNKNIKDCDSSLSLKALLVGRNCKIMASPVLEIANNSVKCMHKVAISVPSKEEIFYLMSRGLSKVSATKFIAEGFITIKND